MVGGGWVKSYLRTRIARLVPSMRRLTHISLVSSLFSQYPSIICFTPKKIPKLFQDKCSQEIIMVASPEFGGLLPVPVYALQEFPCENQKLLLVFFVAGMVSHRTFSSLPTVT